MLNQKYPVYKVQNKTKYLGGSDRHAAHTLTNNYNNIATYRLNWTMGGFSEK